MGTSLARLPREIIDSITKELGQKDLKSLRNCCQVLCAIVTPRVYESFSLYPHQDSLNHLQSISRSPNLRRHVRTVIFNAHFLKFPSKIIEKLKSIWSKDISVNEKQRLLLRAKGFEDGNLDASDPLDIAILTFSLSECFAHLTSLQKFSVIEVPSRGGLVHAELIELPSFYKAMVDETCGMHLHTNMDREHDVPPLKTCQLYSPILLMALGKCNRTLDALELVDVNGPKLGLCRFEKYQEHLSRVFEQLKKISLLFDATTWVGGESGHAIRQFIEQAPRLQELSLDFGILRWIEDRGYSGTDMRHYVDVHYHPTTLSWAISGSLGRQSLCSNRQLRSLVLQGAYTTVSELKAFLKPFKSTLISLDIQNLIIRPEQIGRNIPRSCLVALIKWMSRSLKLEKVILGGTFSNGGLQSWFIDDVYDHVPENYRRNQREGDCLRDLVYRYLTHGGVCPLDHVAIKPDQHDFCLQERDSAVPAVLRRACMVDPDPEAERLLGDGSFEMVYHIDALADDDESSDETDLEGDFMVPLSTGLFM